MVQKLPPQEIKLYRQVDEILYYLWDPIGVAGVAQARDEYSSYTPQLFKLLIENKSKDEVSAYLIDIQRNGMELSIDNKAISEVAEILLNTKEAIIDEGF